MTAVEWAIDEHPSLAKATIVAGTSPGFPGDQGDLGPEDSDTESDNQDEGDVKSSCYVPLRRRSVAGDGRGQLNSGKDATQQPLRALLRPSSMVSMRSSLSRSSRSRSLIPRRSRASSISNAPQEQLVDSAEKPLVGVRPEEPRGMPRLIPASLTPKMRLPKMTQLWAFLDRIEHITVGDVYTTVEDDDSKGTVHYVLHVYTYRERRRVPTNRLQPTRHAPSLDTPPPLREPDFLVHHRFSSFRHLRRRMRKATRAKHSHVPRRYDGASKPRRSSHRDCAYCRRVRDFITTASESVAAFGWRATLSGTVETRRVALGRFVTRLLQLAREQHTQCSNLELLMMVHQPANAYVDKSVPGILRRFLTAQTGENFMR